MLAVKAALQCTHAALLLVNALDCSNLRAAAWVLFGPQKKRGQETRLRDESPLASAQCLPGSPPQCLPGCCKQLFDK